MSLAQQRLPWFLQNTNRKPVLEVKPIGQRGHMANRVANSNEAVACVTSQAFARWLHHHYSPIKLPSAEAYYFAA